MTLFSGSWQVAPITVPFLLICRLKNGCIPAPPAESAANLKLSREPRKFKSKIHVEHVSRGERKWRIRNQICQGKVGDTSRAHNLEGGTLGNLTLAIHISPEVADSYFAVWWADWMIVCFGKGSSELPRWIMPVTIEQIEVGRGSLSGSVGLPSHSVCFS